MRAPADSGSPLSRPDWHGARRSWALHKGADVVHCLVSATGKQAVICIEVASGHSPVSIIQRCEPDVLPDAVEEWRRLFRQRGWCDAHG